jgi:hypothetical protein
VLERCLIRFQFVLVVCLCVVLSVFVSYNLFEKFLKTSAARTRMDANITLSQGVSSLKKFEKINKLNIIATHDNNAHDL